MGAKLSTTNFGEYQRLIEEDLREIDIPNLAKEQNEIRKKTLDEIRKVLVNHTRKELALREKHAMLFSENPNYDYSQRPRCTKLIDL